MWSCQSYMICNSPCVVTVTCGSEVVPYSPDSHEQEESSKPRPNREVKLNTQFLSVIQDVFNSKIIDLICYRLMKEATALRQDVCLLYCKYCSSFRHYSNNEFEKLLLN